MTKDKKLAKAIHKANLESAKDLDCIQSLKDWDITIGDGLEAYPEETLSPTTVQSSPQPLPH